MAITEVETIEHRLDEAGDEPIIGVVITTSAGRRENVEDVLESLGNGDELPYAITIVMDGHDERPCPPPTTTPISLVGMPKHEPGMEQPRNIGTRYLRHAHPECTHVWFLDSDVLVEHTTFSAYLTAIEEVGDGCILIGPYEWMPDGVRHPLPDLRTDYRWAMFNERGRGPFVADLGVALGCFGGNLVWPIDRFVEVGGFHSMLHHGRCEDGELGLRAASHRIPMALVPEARGYHIEHPRDQAYAMRLNEREVPLINEWHPWVQEAGLIVTTEDGARFEYVCACGEQVNTLAMWDHQAQHNVVKRVAHPLDDLILPDDFR